jgi:hypothetical protein
MVEHLDREKDYYRDESQNRQTGNQQTQSSLSTLSAPGPARAFRKQIFAVPRILQDIWRIERAPPSGCARNPLLALTFLLGLSQLWSLLNLALQFFHLPAQFFLPLRELVLFR